MRNRSTLSLVIFAFTSAVAALACVSSLGSGNASPGDDASTGASDAAGSSDGDTSSPNAKASDVSVYVGHVAQLDASGSTPASATFKWLLASAPAGSAITTASLTNANGAKPTFTPDVAGDYRLTLSVSTGGAPSTLNVTVHADAGKTFFAYEKDYADGGTLSEIRFAHGDGTGQATVSCGTYATSLASKYLPSAIDWQEGAVTDDSQFAFGFQEVYPDAGFSNYLGVGRSSSRCATPPAHFDVLANKGFLPRGVRLSPNADRVAYIRDDGSSVQIATIGVDGSNPRLLGPVFPNPADGGAKAAPAAQYLIVPVQWTDETHVAWVADAADGVSWELLTATDSDTPAAASYMTCASTAGGSDPNVIEFAKLADGTVLINATVTTFDAGFGTSDGLALVRPNVSTKQCELVRRVGPSGSGDFSISPDGTTLAFLMDNDAGVLQLFVEPLDGSSAATLVPYSGGGVTSVEGSGPRWIAGGSALVLGGAYASVDGGSTTNVVSIASNGGAYNVVASGGPNETFNAIGNVGSCSIGFGPASPFAAFGMLAVFVGMLVRRKRDVKSP